MSSRAYSDSFSLSPLIVHHCCLIPPVLFLQELPEFSKLVAFLKRICCKFCHRKRPAKHFDHQRTFKGHINAYEVRPKVDEESDMSLIHSVHDKDDFDNQLKEAGTKLVVVDFYATWCGPCKMISPKLEEMAQQFTDVIFLKVDVDECEEVASAYNISCMPTFMFFKKSEKVDEFSGANADKIKEFIVKHK